MATVGASLLTSVDLLLPLVPGHPADGISVLLREGENPREDVEGLANFGEKLLTSSSDKAELASQYLHVTVHRQPLDLEFLALHNPLPRLLLSIRTLSPDTGEVLFFVGDLALQGPMQVMEEVLGLNCLLSDAFCRTEDAKFKRKMLIGLFRLLPKGLVPYPRRLLNEVTVH
ncbi:hypothetical protein HDK64DRAFT_258936 [Phyllosticta capitalensis]